MSAVSSHISPPFLKSVSFSVPEVTMTKLRSFVVNYAETIFSLAGLEGNL